MTACSVCGFEFDWRPVAEHPRHTEEQLDAIARQADARAGPLVFLAKMFLIDPAGIEAILPRRQRWSPFGDDWTAFGSAQRAPRTARLAGQRRKSGVASRST